MSDWLISIEGTGFGEQVAIILALIAAFLHAVFGALQKGRHDPWLSRGAIDFSLVLISLPVALFLVPWPQGHVWLLLLGSVVIHFVYKMGQALAYARGAYTVVYPVVRGTGPLFTVFGAWLVFGESFQPLQWLGVAVLLGGIFGLAVYNLRHVEVGRDTLVPALMLAVFTGALVALYTTWDAYGMRSTLNPFTFLMWFFFLSSLDFPVIAALCLRNMAYPPPLKPLFLRGLTGAFVAWGSFGAIMIATRIGKVGEAAVSRETSPVFAALIGWLVLRETVGPRRIALMTMIALGAVLVELGG